MDETLIKSYLEKIKWMGFSKRIEQAVKWEPLITEPVIKLYLRLRIRKDYRFRDKIYIKIILTKN